MSGNPFTNFLGGVVGGTFGPSGNLRDYEHANRLYVQNNYARAPKVGFIYFVEFDINPNAIKNIQWKQKKLDSEVGLLVKKIDMPKFTMAHEVVNQYNKKNVIQTGIKYNPVNIEFHDDNSDITTALWTNYYKYYYVDSTYGDSNQTKNAKQNTQTSAFNNSKTGTKYADTGYRYGLNSNQNDPFFNSINIYVLHQHKFTKMTLVNPLVTEWSHDNLDQTEPNKILSSKMTVAYEAVLYDTGRIQKGQGDGFTAHYYDKTPSPLSVGGKGNSTIFGAGGILNGVDSVFGALESGNFLGAAIQAATTIRNAKNITKAGLIAEGTGLVNSALAGIATSNLTKDNLNAANAGGAALNSINQNGQLGVIIPNGQFSVDNQTQATQRLVTKIR